MSATAVHFSITAMRAAKLGRRITSEATNRETYQNISISLKCILASHFTKSLIYLIETFGDQNDMGCSEKLVRLHPRLSQ